MFLRQKNHYLRLYQRGWSSNYHQITQSGIEEKLGTKIVKSLKLVVFLLDSKLAKDSDYSYLKYQKTHQLYDS